MQHTPTLPPPEWIYDRFMSAIEPELTSARMPYLEAEYAGESPEAHEQRMHRYSAAFQTFGDVLRQFSEYLYTQAREIQADRRDIRSSQEAGERARLLTLADSLLTAPDTLPPSA